MNEWRNERDDTKQIIDIIDKYKLYWMYIDRDTKIPENKYCEFMDKDWRRTNFTAYICVWYIMITRCHNYWQRSTIYIDINKLNNTIKFIESLPPTK